MKQAPAGRFTAPDFAPQALAPGGHTCRPSFADLPGFGADDTDVEAFHLEYLKAAARASPAGLVTGQHGEVAAIGGTAWSARVTRAGVKMVTLGQLGASSGRLAAA